MNAHATIAHKEWRTAIRDRILIVIALLFVAMSIASVYIGSSTKGTEQQVYADIVQLAQQQGTEPPAAPVIYPLEILANITDYIIMIGAVLAIFLGYRSMRAEHDGGTLTLIRSRPLTYTDILAGKWMGAAGLIGLLLSVTFLFNLVLFILVSGLSPTLGEVIRLAVSLAFAFVYMMMFYTAALAITWKTNNGTFAFMVMMTIWIFISFVIPQLADTQRNYAYAISNISGVVSTTPSETPVSQAINLFSPAAQFTHLGNMLLQADSDTATLALPALLAKAIPLMLYLIAWNLGLMLLLFRKAAKEESSR